MRRAEIITAFIFGVFSIYLMWKSGEPPAWNPSVPRFASGDFDETGTPGSGFWPFWLGFYHADMYDLDWHKLGLETITAICIRRTVSGLIMEKNVSNRWRGAYRFSDHDSSGRILRCYVPFSWFITSNSLAGIHGLLTLIIASAMPVVSFFFFDVAMRIVLPKGYLEPLFIPLYDIFFKN